MLSVRSVGGDLPDFAAANTVPAPVTFELPADGTTVDRNVDLPMSWAPGGPDPVAFSLLALFGTDDPEPSQRSVQITCHSSPGDTRLVIPREVLAKVEPRGNNQGRATQVALLAARANQTRVWAGDFLVTFTIRAGFTYRHLVLR